MMAQNTWAPTTHVGDPYLDSRLWLGHFILWGSEPSGQGGREREREGEREKFPQFTGLFSTCATAGPEAGSSNSTNCLTWVAGNQLHRLSSAASQRLGVKTGLKHKHSNMDAHIARGTFSPYLKCLPLVKAWIVFEYE